MIRKLFIAGLLAVLGACASPSLRYSGVITANEEPHSHAVPTRKVALKDRVVVVTRVAWPEADRDGGLHAVEWHWYEGETLIAPPRLTSIVIVVFLARGVWKSMSCWPLSFSGQSQVGACFLT